MRLETALVSAAAIIALGACDGSNELSVSSSNTSAAADCPPEQKGEGIMVSSRYDYEDLIEANKWRTEMFPAACAGKLSALVPDLPNGFGVKPTHKPYVMNDEQVYVAYARLVEPLYLDEETANVPVDLETIEYEIVRFTDEERKTLSDWMTANPDSYLSDSVAGHDVHFIGGFGSGRPGKGDRLGTSLHALLDNNIVVRISHKDFFSQGGGLDVPPLVETVLGDIIARSGTG
ncbi:MAG: hypothetical protein Hens2KO_09920 [Henriciella sp.]